MRGFFITFEGNEGSGKTTQIATLARRLQDGGREVVVLREPGGTPIGEEIRHILKHSPNNAAMTWKAELLLMNASRAQLVGEIIEPALLAGKVVVCDRFYDSTLVYQGYGRQLDPVTVRAVIEVAVGKIVPDVTFLLRVSTKTSYERRNFRNQTQSAVRDRMEEADAGFFDRVEKGYEALAQEEKCRVVTIDGEADPATVAERIWNEAQKRFQAGF
ncbi:MAG: dTMP kinase [Verrucomicrobiales bacterium]|nr:dTMP kinase [Verrucomicrobiales bacterium]